MLETSGTVRGSATPCGTHDAHPSLPTGTFFFDALVDVLGEQADYRALEPVHATLDGLIKPVLRHAGIDPDTHPLVTAGHWPLDGHPKKRDLNRRVGFAMRNQREKYCSGSRVPLTALLGTNLWALTEAGVEAALSRRREDDLDWRGPGWERNFTAEWFAQHGAKTIDAMERLAATFFDSEVEREDTRPLFEALLSDLVDCDGLRVQLESDQPLNIHDLVVRAVALPEDPELPKPTPMFGALIDALCVASGFQSGKGVPVTAELYADILTRFGIDPTKHPLVTSGIWSMKGKQGLYRKVQHAMKWQADTYVKTCPMCRNKLDGIASECCGVALKLSYPKSQMRTSYVTVEGKRDQWALTPAGVVDGLTRRAKGRSLTQLWMEINPQIQLSLHELLRLRFRRLSREYIDNGIDLWLTGIYNTDQLRDELLSGAPPSDEALTQMCCEFIREMSDKRNATADWFAVDAAKKVAFIRRRMAGALAKSRNLGEIDDLVNDFITNAIRLDSITRYLAKNPGRTVTVRAVSNWALKSAYSKFRDAAGDCHHRTFRDARTKDERDAYEVANSSGEFRNEARKTLHRDVVRHSVPSENVPVHLTTNTEGRSAEFAGSVSCRTAPLIDVMCDADIEARLIHKMDRDRGLALIETAIRNHKPGAGDRYVGIFHKVIDPDQDYSTREIADSEGVQRNRAASLTQDMRNALRASANDCEQALTILDYVSEEPFATERDLHTDLGLDFTHLLKVLGWLSNSGWLETREASSAQSDAEIREHSYLITRRGTAMLNEQRDPDLALGLANRLFI